jgi:hypothetical protein
MLYQQEALLETDSVRQELYYSSVKHTARVMQRMLTSVQCLSNMTLCHIIIRYTVYYQVKMLKHHYSYY